MTITRFQIIRVSNRVSMVRLLRKYLAHDAQKQQHRGLEISDWSTAVRPHAVDVWTAC